MTAAIAHRGPDGHGHLVRDGVGFGHRRLAIIDPDHGHQPMSNDDESVWISYNGEVYNFQSLRSELSELGHVCQTHSDTEVVLRAYEAWGVDCVDRFRGMFAFAIADFSRRRMMLARDHFGIKPLYYRIGDGYLGFASELSALREIDDEVPRGSLQAIDEYLMYQYIPTPRTIYQGICKLPPAHMLVADFDGKVGAPSRYWDFGFDATESRSEEDWAEEFDAVIRDSVRAHLVADVPFGVFLSGGLDSTLIAREMERLLDRPVNAFSIGFQEEEFSELKFARQAAERIGVELHTEVVDERLDEVLPPLVAHYGEPFGDSSSIPTWFVSRLARQHVPMVLSGDGGDEAFGGYGSYAAWMAPLRATVRPRQLAIWAYLLLRRLLYGKRRSWESLIRFYSPDQRRTLWRQEYCEVVRDDCPLFVEAAQRAARFDRLGFAQYIDYQAYQPCDILTKVDVASMFHGLEVRTPLIDRRVVELAARLPLGQRLSADSNGATITKPLMKRSLAADFPASFLQRRKQGFAIPRTQWLSPGASGHELLQRTVLDPQSRLHELFQSDAIKQFASSHTNDSGFAWLLLVLGIWLEQNREVTFG